MAGLRQPLFGVAAARLRQYSGQRVHRDLARLRRHLDRGGVVGGQREPEVQHHHAPVLTDHHVVGLEVAVHQTRVVGRREPLPRLHEHVADVRPGASRAPTPLFERLPVKPLHRHEQPLAQERHVENLDDVRMRQPSQGLSLAQQSRGSTARRLPRVQDLDRDLAIEPVVARQVHDPHAAPPELAGDLVATDRVGSLGVLAHAGRCYRTRKRPRPIASGAASLVE